MKNREKLLAACAYDKLQAMNRRLNKLTLIRGEERRPACIMDAVGTNKGNACAKMPNDKNCGECIQRWLNSEVIPYGRDMPH